MSVPHVAGDRDMPEWWSPADEAILRGELAKLAELPRPAVPAERPSGLLWWIVGPVVLLLVGLVVALVAWMPAGPAPCPGGAAGCADVATPTTYGPPGPRGGFVR